MYTGIGENSLCVTLSPAAEALLLSSKFLDAGVESGKLLQAWTFSDGDLRADTSRFNTFTGIGISYESASPAQDSPQRAEWICDEYTLDEQKVDSFSSAQLVCAALPDRSHEFVYGLNGLINSLPDELLCHVFHFLPAPRDRSACASVSKRWLSLQSHMHQDELFCSCSDQSSDEAGDEVQSRESTSNCTISPSSNQKRVNRQQQWAVGDLSRCLEGRKASDIRLAAVAVGTGACGGLGKLSIRQGVITDVGLSAIGYCCSALKTLCLWDCPYIEDEGLSLIGKGCSLLEKVDLFRCPLAGDRGLQSIAKNCSLLSFLSLDECVSITDRSLVAVGEGCPNLLSLSIRNCPLVGDDGLVSAVCNLKRLKRMKVDGLNVGDRTLACIGLYAKALVRLSVANLELVTEEGFISFSLAQGLPSLQRFTVTSCRGFGDTAFSMIGKMQQGLKNVSLVKCDRVTDMGLSLFMQNAASLEVLHLEMCNFVSATGLIPVFLNKYGRMREVHVKKCEGIQEARIQGASFSSSAFFSNASSVKSISITGCPGVANLLLALIGCLCPHATSIDFSGLTGISDEGVLAFLYSGRRQLASINLSGCRELTDRCVCAIAEQCWDSLRSISLDGCKRVTDKGLKSMAKHCIFLEDLDVSECSVTNEGATVLVHELGCNLSSLNLSSCRGITDGLLPFIGKCCDNLSDLNLKHCQGLSKKSIDLLESRMWNCNVVSA